MEVESLRSQIDAIRQDMSSQIEMEYPGKRPNRCCNAAGILNSGKAINMNIATNDNQKVK